MTVMAGKARKAPGAGGRCHRRTGMVMLEQPEYCVLLSAPYNCLVLPGAA
ncbi:hypothetical protein KY495_23200 [Massilia sp. PAMC28688]|nr:hypothetical protein [Massilia sp. PAMC28688]QYF93527.1 hypothetical protein KY495_23200 [Massilia sp. PAMC28688]